MPVLVLDPNLEQRIRADRVDPQVSRYDEVWEGVLVVAPLPNNDHQRIVMRLGAVFSSVIDWSTGNQVLPGANVSDREMGWLANYREPDVAVYLAANPAVDCGSHWVGGPDLAVEVVSPGEQPRDKLAFYAQVNTREVLIVDRDPWKLELYQLQAGQLLLQESAEVGSAILACNVLPLTFQLLPGMPRPTILITHNVTKQSWTA
jgi:Uma2 family endonuclease